MKRKLSQQEEFGLMTLVLDKFLWLGVGIMGFGLWKVFSAGLDEGIYYIISGALVLILFMVLIIKEFEYVR